MAKLTGKSRLVERRRWFGRPIVVLQVEEYIQSEADEGYGLLPVFIKQWRDATPAEKDMEFFR